MKGVILAGGLGTRLRPATNVVNKHLLNVYDRPMIFWPIYTLKDMGVKEIMVITGEENAGMFVDLLKDGRDFGVSITYGFQHGSCGIAEALKVARPWIGKSRVAVILGDNYFEKVEDPGRAAIFLKFTSIARNFGVYFELDQKIIEKPDIDEGFAVTGLYVYEGSDLQYLDKLKRSKRGELEITDFNNILLKKCKLKKKIVKGHWSDMGTPDTLLDTANFIKRNVKRKV